MINEIKQAIANKLKEIYPHISIYDEDVPQGFKTPSFLIVLVENSYKASIDNRFSASASFDLAYFPSNEFDRKNECYEISQQILRSFDVVNGFKVTNKTSNVTDNILHIKFTIKYREIKIAQYEKMRDIIFE